MQCQRSASSLGILGITESLRLLTLEFAENGAVVQVAIAVRDHACEQTIHESKQRQIEPEASRQVERSGRVLHLVLRWTTGSEVPGDHALTVLTKHSRVRKAAKQRRAHLGGIRATSFGQEHAL